MRWNVKGDVLQGKQDDLGVMTHFVDVPPQSSLIYECACGGRYLPLG